MRGQDDHTPFSSCADDVPCRSAAVWIHTCALQKALLVFDIFRYQSESSCRSSTALVCCKELEWHWPYLLQFWMLHLHFLHLQFKHHHEVRLKSYNYITIYYIPIFSPSVRSPIPRCLKSAHPRRPQEVSQSAPGKAKAFSFGHRTELLQKRSDPGRQSQSHSDSTVTPSPQLQDMSCTSLCLFGQTNLLHHLVATASHLQIWAPRCFWCFCMQSWQQAMRTSSKLK